MKANPHPRILDLLRRAGVGIDAEGVSNESDGK